MPLQATAYSKKNIANFQLTNMNKQLNRRQFIQTSALGAAGLMLSPNASPEAESAPSILKQPLNDRLRLGFIGVGLRGQNHLELALDRADCEVTAICDIDQGMIDDTLKMIADKGKSKPKIYGLDEHAFRELVADPDVDAVVIATPWRWHSEMAIAAMKAGKYTGMEVCGGFSLDECWQLVNTHEETGAHLFFLENVNYRRDIMAVMRMVREGLFGELIHVEGGYQHDLREVKFNNGTQPYGGGVEFGDKGYSEARWRTYHSIHRNAELYPTHGLGPVATLLDINRGNRMLYLTSMSTKSRGLHNYIMDHEKGGPGHPNAKIEFKLGDVVTTMIKCSNGESITLFHDTSLPRPYSLGFRVQGTKGLWMDVNQSLYIEGQSSPRRWEEAQAWLDKYDHPLWKRYENEAVGAGHGGMDFFLFHAFIEGAKRNEAPPIDVYDGATWLAITPLSEDSVAMGSQPVAIPDFTRGRWTMRKPVFGFSDVY